MLIFITTRANLGFTMSQFLESTRCKLQIRGMTTFSPFYFWCEKHNQPFGHTRTVDSLPFIKICKS